MDALSFRHSLLSVVAAGVVAGLPIGAVMMIRGSCSVTAPEPVPDAPALADVEVVHTSAVANERGVLVGFRVVDVKPGSFLAHLGLRDGDVVTAVNGRAVQRNADVYDVFEEREVAVDFVRDGQHGTLRHSL